MPTCLPFNDRLWRIWFGGRDGQRRSRPLCIDVDPGDGMRILALRDVPGLDLGPEGAFDSAGVWPSAVLEAEGRVMMWYTGTRLDRPWPYSLAIGLAVSRGGGLSFEKEGEGPVLPAGEVGHFATSPCVRRFGDGFEMWYSRCIDWRATGPEGALDPPKLMSRETLRTGYQTLLRRLYEPEAYFSRLFKGYKATAGLRR